MTETPEQMVARLMGKTEPKLELIDGAARMAAIREQVVEPPKAPEVPTRETIRPNAINSVELKWCDLNPTPDEYQWSRIPDVRFITILAGVNTPAHARTTLMKLKNEFITEKYPDEWYRTPAEHDATYLSALIDLREKLSIRYPDAVVTIKTEPFC